VLIYGPAVLLSGRECARLEPFVAMVMATSRRDGLPVVAEMQEVLDAILRAGRGFRSTARSVDGTCGIPSEVPSVMVRDMTSTDVAEQLGCTERNVVGLVARKSLPARRVGRRWVFDPLDVADLLTQRQEAS